MYYPNFSKTICEYCAFTNFRPFFVKIRQNPTYFEKNSTELRYSPDSCIIPCITPPNSNEQISPAIIFPSNISRFARTSPE